MQKRTTGHFHILTLAILLFAFLPAAVENVSAQGTSDISLKAEAGFDGYAKEGTWIPIHIFVENKGPDVEGSVDVYSKGYSGNATVYSASISLPTTSRKEFFIYFYYPNGGVSRLTVEVKSGSKVLTRTSAMISNLTPQSLMVGLLTDSPSSYNSIAQIQTQNGITRLVQIEPASLPERPQGWESLDAIIISSADTGLLSADQKKALELWVAKGGTLFVSGGPKWQSTVQGVKELLPIQVSGTTNTTAPAELTAYTAETFPEESSTILATGRLTGDAAVLATQDGNPLLTQRQLGRGHVIFFAADPSLEPYKNWDGMVGVYQSIFGFNPPRAAWANGKWDNYNSNEAITTLAELDIPSIYFICGWLGFYILLIGPVNYIFLRIIKKLEWAWVTIPAIVVVISTISYVYGFLYRGTTPTLNRLNVIQAWDGASQAESSSLVGIYSPQRRRYTLESAENFLLYPSSSGDINLQGDTAWMSQQEGNNTVAPNIPVEIGGMKIIAATGIVKSLKIEHNLTIEFRNGAPFLIGTITNQDEVALNDAVLVTPGEWVQLGDLAPGQAKDVKLSIDNNGGVPSFYNQDVMTILNLSYTDLDTNKEARRKNALMRAVLSTEYGENNMNWGIYLMGWPYEAPPSAVLKGEAPKIEDTTFYIHSINPRVQAAKNDFTLTSAMFEWEISNPDGSPYYIYGGNGPYTYEFHPGTPVKFSEIKALTLELDSYLTPADFVVSLWDYTQNEWVVINNIKWLGYKVPDPAKYVNQSGDVRMMIASAQNSYIEMRRITISMTVIP